MGYGAEHRPKMEHWVCCFAGTHAARADGRDYRSSNAAHLCTDGLSFFIYGNGKRKGIFDERKERRDYEYMKSLYPDVAKRLLPYIEEECDRMEYDNSMMYDEYPDRLQLHLMCKRVCENVRKHEKIFYGTEYEGLLSQAEENSVMQMEEAERMQEPESEWEPEFMQVQEQNRREPERRRMPNWLQNLIEVMLYHELYKRRSDHRRSRHRIY